MDHSGANAEDAREERDESAVVINVTVHHIVWPIAALDSPHLIYLPKKIAVTRGHKDPPSAPDHFGIVCARSGIVNQEINAGAASINVAEHANQPGLSTGALGAIDNLQDADLPSHASRLLEITGRDRTEAIQNKHIPQKCPNAGTG
jgi:hypothetical protein